jgi:hypothetical protein
MAIASAPLSEAPFLVGTAISVWQNSGGEPTNWATWAAKRNMFGWSTIKRGDKASRSPYRARHWLRSHGRVEPRASDTPALIRRSSRNQRHA